MNDNAIETYRWPDAAQLLQLVWPWAQRQRWCAAGEPQLVTFVCAGAHAVLLARVGQQLLQLPLTQATDGVLIIRTDDYCISDGATSASFVSAWAQAAIPEAAAQLDPHDGRVRDLVKDAPVFPLSGEQSNSSVRRAGTMVKFFRSPVVGTNPEVSVSNALWQQGFTNLPAPLASSHLTLPSGDCLTTAFATRLIDNAQDGFEWASSQKQLDLVRVSELGAITKQLHRALAAAFPTQVTRFAPAPRLATRLAEVAQHLPAAVLARVEQLLNQLDRVTFSGTAQRIHGDFHLGQCLSANTWYILDFEGEPLRSLAEREAPDFAERDVAGMLRSFAYAAAVGKHPESWLEAAQTAYLRGYGELDSGALAFFMLEKALYEVKYEALYRPDWVAIPLAGVTAATIALTQWLANER